MRPYRLYRKPKPAPERRREQEYVMLKESWRVLHPTATPEEYARAMQDIARKLGL